MYLAFRWLIFLTIAMWGLLCIFDLHMQRKKVKASTRLQPIPIDAVQLNDTMIKKIIEEKIKINNSQWQSIALLNYLTFLAGGLAVTVYNKKTDILKYLRAKISIIKSYIKAANIPSKLNKTAIHVRVAIIQNLQYSLENICVRVAILRILQYIQEKSVELFLGLIKLYRLKNVVSWSKSTITTFSDDEKQKRNERNLLLLQRLRHLNIERNKLGHLLVVAIRENKNIKLQYQVEIMAKKRLLQQMQVTQQLMNENRAKYVNFQQLYLETNQENVFLKHRLKKLTKDKQEAEASLMSVIGRVYQSSDTNLKAYCTCFIVKNKENLLASDVKKEIATFVKKCNDESLPKRSQAKDTNSESDTDLPSSSVYQLDKGTGREVVRVSPVEPKPKLRGSPREYVWTVKDKDGIIEKLYEYDYGYGLDHGHSIRRIREYSVYHDSDCLLDFANSSTTIIQHRASSNIPRGSCYNPPSGSNCINMPSRNFLTESPIFQKFMKTNNLTIPRSPSLMCS